MGDVEEMWDWREGRDWVLRIPERCAPTRETTSSFDNRSLRGVESVEVEKGGKGTY